MAMTMTGEVQLPAPRQTVWEKLNDPEVLKVTIPGCESLEKTSDTSFQAVAVTKIGPVKAKWKGKVTLTDLDPPNGYRIVGEGEGGVAGFAKGAADVRLSDKEIARQRFEGRSTTSVSKEIAMPQVLAGGTPGASSPLTFTREGAVDERDAFLHRPCMPGQHAVGAFEAEADAGLRELVTERTVQRPGGAVASGRPDGPRDGPADGVPEQPASAGTGAT